MNNNNSSHHENVKETVLEKIRTGEVHMRPRFYFTLKIILLVIIVFLILLTSSLLISFILFSIRISGQMLLLGFGFRGIAAFFLLFPWRMLIIDILLLVLLEWLVKRFKFGYRNSLMSLLIGLGLFTLFAALLIDETPVHSILLRRAENQHLPVIGGMYAHLRRPPREQGIVRGTVTSIKGNVFTIAHNDHDNSPDDGIREIVAPPGVDLNTILSVGDSVYVAGTMVNNQLHAYGITKLPLDTQQ